MTEPENLSLEVLRQIRDELITTRTDLGGRLDQTNARLSAVETPLLDLAGQQRFVVRHLSTLAHRDQRLELDVEELRARVERLEARVPPG